MHPLHLVTVALAFGAQVAPAGGAGTAPPGMAAGINTILQWSQYLGYGVAMLGLVAAGAMMAVSHSRGTVGEHGAKIATAVGSAIVIGSATGIISALAK
jgi:hypothetical protein